MLQITLSGKSRLKLFLTASFLFVVAVAFISCAKPNLAGALRQYDYKTAMMRLEEGEHPDSSYYGDHSALFWATNPAFLFERDVSVIETLLERGADPNLTTSDGKTPLFNLLDRFTLAGSSHHDLQECCKWLMKAVELLLAHGADVNLADANGHTPLKAATAPSKNACLDVALLLIERGANPHVTFRGGITSTYTYNLIDPQIRTWELYGEKVLTGSTQSISRESRPGDHSTLTISAERVSEVTKNAVRTAQDIAKVLTTMGLKPLHGDQELLDQLLEAELDSLPD